MNNNNKLIPPYRFPEFKDYGSWDKSTIQTVSEIKGRIGYRGYTTSDIVEKGEGAITLSPSNIIDGKLNFSKSTYISWEKYNESPEIMLEEGQTVLVKTASVGKTAYVSNLPEKTTLNPQIVVLKPYNKIDKKLLSYCTAHEDVQKQILNKVGAGAIPNLSQENIGNIEIVLPSNPTEQQKIAACLSSLDDVIAGHEEKLKALEEHKKGLMQNLFPQEGETTPRYRFPFFVNDGEWVKKKLGSIGDPLMCKRIFKEETTTVEVGNVPFYKIGTFGKTADAFITFEKYEEYKLKFSFPKKGDILISASGTIGRLVVYDGKSAYFQDSNIIWLGHNEKELLNTFLLYVYQSLTWQTSDGGIISRLYNSDFKNMEIIFPTNPNEQQKIAEALSSVDAIIVAQREKIEALKDHKKGLMQGLFPKIEI